ncbi:MAG TPA: universal stress protein [Acidimicrobiales bacterium]|nr:universal stress protein [Acidimicrobiales bacterium]
MRKIEDRRIATPDVAVPTEENGAPFRRVLVLVESFTASTKALSLAARIGQSRGGPLRVVHVRMWDRAMPLCGGRFYPETSEQATMILDSAMTFVWARGVEASGVVIEAERSRIAAAVIAEASRWGADVIVLTARPRHFFTPGMWEKTTNRVMRASFCPVLSVYPRLK